MLSYRHSYHAGNHADVLKHTVLVALLRHFLRKEKPFTYMDSHAGAGLYRLDSSEARKTGEAAAGITRLWQQPVADPLLSDYLAQVRRHNSDGHLAMYPGSPAIALNLLRETDRACLIELHSTEIELLRDNFKGDPRVAIHHRDACEGLRALAPPTPRRGLALIDPAYEVSDDYDEVEATLHELHRKWAVGTLMLWYPLLATGRDRSALLRRGLARGNISSLLCIELTVAPQQQDYGMYGSGLLIVNPPWQLDEQVRSALAELPPLLGVRGADAPRIEWLLKPA